MKNYKVIDEYLDFDREYIVNLNNDKFFIIYGFFELDVVDYFVYSSGIIGYWDKSNKVVIGILYFGVWKYRVCSS